MYPRRLVPQSRLQPPPPSPPPPLSPSANGRRPLSDIREITEPNLIEAAAFKQVTTPSSQRTRTPESHRLPDERIPPRSSSRQRHQRTESRFRGTERTDFGSSRTDQRSNVVRNATAQRSPVKETVERLCPFESSVRHPSKTINRINEPSLSQELLDHPEHLHHRVFIGIETSAPLFVGGSSVEGLVQILVDNGERTRRRKNLRLERVSLDLLGVEEISTHLGSKRHVFLHRSNAIIDPDHPPPSSMLELPEPFQRAATWTLLPCKSALRFHIALPLEVGPPPFESKHARIRYVLSVTLLVYEGDRLLCVRVSHETALLSVYDRECQDLLVECGDTDVMQPKRL